MDFTKKDRLVSNVYESSNIATIAKLDPHSVITSDMFMDEETFKTVDNIRDNIVDTLWIDEYVAESLLVVTDDRKLASNIIYSMVRTYVEDTKRVAPSRNVPRLAEYHWDVISPHIDSTEGMLYSFLNCELLVLHVTDCTNRLLGLLSARNSNGRPTIINSVLGFKAPDELTGLVSQMGTIITARKANNEE